MLLTLFSPVLANLGDGFWTTSGRNFLDAEGNIVKIAGVNWFGFETGNFAPHGLWSVNWKYTMDSIASHGFNTLRIPWSNDIMRGTWPNGINYDFNQDLRGKNSLEVLDVIIDYAGALGLKVILDRHRPDGNGQSPLWYTDKVSEQQWIDDWISLARRYLNNPTVIGADLHNEPRDQACWGCGDYSRDWRWAAERCGNAILKVHPKWLIFVEGINWGSDITQAGFKQVNLDIPNRIVYSIHDYGPTVVGWQQRFTDPNFPNNMPGFYNQAFGYLLFQNIAPVVVGEFGTKLEIDTDRKWLEALTNYMRDTGASWTYWCWNPDSGDTGGLVNDDWRTYRWDKDSYLNKIKFKLGRMNAKPAVNPDETDDIEDEDLIESGDDDMLRKRGFHARVNRV